MKNSIRIRRVTDSREGPLDGVELMTQCSTSRFLCGHNGKPIKVTGPPEVHPCKIMASYETGIASISVHGIGVMVSVRLSELTSLLSEAVEAGKELGEYKLEAMIDEYFKK